MLLSVLQDCSYLQVFSFATSFSAKFVEVNGYVKRRRVIIKLIVIVSLNASICSSLGFQ